jgi:pimeloyl-ACP methyl ester carboxylesterase
MPKLEIIEYHPQIPAHDTPLVFVHGAWHGAWCWEPHFLPWFREKGFHSLAFSFRNHGKSGSTKPLNRVRVGEYVEDLAEVVGRLGKEPIIIAHSMGGLVAQKYLEKYSAKAVVLITPVPPQGTLGAVARTFVRHPLNFLQSLVRLDLYYLLNTLPRARRMLFSDSLPEKELMTYQAKLKSESFSAFLVDLNFPRIKRKIQAKVPMLVIAGGKDKIFSVKEQERTAAFYEATLKVFPELPHNLMLDPGWELVAERVYEWMEEKGLDS